LTALECTKFVFGHWEAFSAPKTPSWFKGALLIKKWMAGNRMGRKGVGRKGRGKGEGKAKKVKGMGGKENRSIPPLIPAYAPEKLCRRNLNKI